MPDEEGRVPEHLREALEGLLATGDNDVARGSLEDNNPTQLSSRVIGDSGRLDATWRVAASLDQLLAEINASAPHRSKVADGSIGDEDHQSRLSDHNPWCNGWVVTARDFTHDPAGGFDSYVYAEWQRQRCRGDILINGRREIRVKYIISNRKIASPTNNWAWRQYSGASPHDHHVHISVDCTAEGGYMDSTQPWGWGEDMSEITNEVWNDRPAQITSGLDRPAGQSQQDVWNAVHKGNMLKKIDDLVARPAAVPPPATLASDIAAALVANDAFLDAIADRVLDKQAQRLQS